MKRYFVTLREVNGVGSCYEINHYQTDDPRLIEERFEQSLLYHRSMGPNGYCERIDQTPEYEALKVAQESIYRILKGAFKPQFQSGWGRLTPEQGIVAKEYRRKTCKTRKDALKVINTFVDFSGNLTYPVKSGQVKERLDNPLELKEEQLRYYEALEYINYKLATFEKYTQLS